MSTLLCMAVISSRELSLWLNIFNIKIILQANKAGNIIATTWRVGRAARQQATSFSLIGENKYNIIVRFKPMSVSQRKAPPFLIKTYEMLEVVSP